MEAVISENRCLPPPQHIALSSLPCIISKQNLRSEEFVLWDMSPPSPQDCQLPQYNYLSFYPTRVSQYWILFLFFSIQIVVILFIFKNWSIVALQYCVSL